MKAIGILFIWEIKGNLYYILIGINIFLLRYDVVVHMVTAADGAEKFYTLENNAARYEDVPTAKIVD